MGILIYGIVILFGFGELLRFMTPFGVEVKPLDVLVLIVSGEFLITSYKQVYEAYYFKPLTLFLLAGLLGIALNTYLEGNQIIVALLYMIRFLSIVLLFPLIVSLSPIFKKRISRLMIAVGIVILVCGYIQYVNYSDLRNLYYLGWDDHMYRMFSVFLDPNYAAAFFNFMFIGLMGLTFQAFNNKKKMLTILFGLLSLAAISAIFLTYSRSGLVMCVVSSTIFFILVNRKKYVIPVLLSLIIATVFVSRFFYIENLNLFRTASSAARITSAQEAIAIFSKSSFIGVGFNAYKYAQVYYGYRIEKNTEKSHADAGTDNSFLFVLATTGVIGFSFYMWFWWTIFQRRYGNYMRTKNVIEAVMIAMILGVFIDSFFINSLFYSPILISLMVMLGVTENT